MTWNEFKIEVEKQMKEKGISLDSELNYIDISSNLDFGNLEVFNGEWGIAIC